MVEQLTTIQITVKLQKELLKNGYMGEKYEDVIWRLLGQHKKKEAKSKPKYMDSL